MDWSGVDYCDVLSAVWTLILTAPIHCRASDVMLHFSKSDEETNYILDLVNLQQMFIFGSTISLTKMNTIHTTRVI